MQFFYCYFYLGSKTDRRLIKKNFYCNYLPPKALQTILYIDDRWRQFGTSCAPFMDVVQYSEPLISNCGTQQRTAYQTHSFESRQALDWQECESGIESRSQLLGSTVYYPCPLEYPVMSLRQAPSPCPDQRGVSNRQPPIRVAVREVLTR